MCFAVVCCKVGMNYVDGGAVLSGLFGLCARWMRGCFVE